MLLKFLKSVVSPKRPENPIHPVSDQNLMTIITPPHTLYLAHLLWRTLTLREFQVQINVGEFMGDFSNSRFIVLCPQVFARLPASYIAFQMEQTDTHWFDSRYLSLLKNTGVVILDYSKRNIPYLIGQGIDPQRIRAAQLTVFNGYRDFLIGQGLASPMAADKEYDVLFYGGINERRFHFLSRLEREFRLKVAVGIFGSSLYELIARSRVVVNIHILDQSPLESTRLFEALSLGARLVSESAHDLSDYADLDKHVPFVPVNDTEAMVKAIRANLQPIGNPNMEHPLSPDDNFAQAVDWAMSQLG